MFLMSDECLTCVCTVDMLSYFVVADLLLALHLDAAADPSTLTVSVEPVSYTHLTLPTNREV